MPRSGRGRRCRARPARAAPPGRSRHRRRRPASAAPTAGVRRVVAEPEVGGEIDLADRQRADAVGTRRWRPTWATATALSTSGDQRDVRCRGRGGRPRTVRPGLRDDDPGERGHAGEGARSVTPRSPSLMRTHGLDAPGAEPGHERPHVVAGRVLGRQRHGVLEVEDDRAGAGRQRLGEAVRAMPRHVEVRARRHQPVPQPVRRLHRHRAVVADDVRRARAVNIGWGADERRALAGEHRRGRLELERRRAGDRCRARRTPPASAPSAGRGRRGPGSPRRPGRTGRS